MSTTNMLFEAIERVGNPVDEVTREPQEDSVKRFAESFDTLAGTIAAKRDEMLTHAR